MFCKQFLAYTVYIDWCYYPIHKHSSRSQHISVLTTCTFMSRQVFPIRPSFFKTTLKMHLRPFECRHLAKILSTYLSMILMIKQRKFFSGPAYRDEAVSGPQQDPFSVRGSREYAV